MPTGVSEEASLLPDDLQYAMQHAHTTECFSESIPAPSSKYEIQQAQDLQLLRFSQSIIHSWIGPVMPSSGEFTNRLAFGPGVNKKLRDLEEGIQALIGDMGGNSRSLQIPTNDKLDVNLRTDDSVVRNYGLFSCLKTDLHKVEIYVTTIKCRRLGGNDCNISAF
ncbi:somatotropin-like [Hemicordylus capensis]|uniref:somatotropin-like n=1 Tax=Hemicordylus capensis TaxID=884348 RepID=UPI0023035C9F|nr:somatotropin-like [Hemicordylus capensis]